MRLRVQEKDKSFAINVLSFFFRFVISTRIVPEYAGVPKPAQGILRPYGTHFSLFFVSSHRENVSLCFRISRIYT